ncbi:MAG: InlB B-repeat-containing protein [Paludibacteraceae bacterium]|nr:InlB B-repeat-containing protein [Paludibacteraceae bacterium]
MKHNLFVIALLLAIFTLSAFTAKADVPEPLTFTATNDAAAKVMLYSPRIVQTSTTTTNAHKKIQYSFDKLTWTNITLGTAIEIPAGSSLYMRGMCTTGINWQADNDNHYHFRITAGYVELSGDLMSLIDSTQQVTTIPCNYCFWRLFYSNEGSSYTYNKARILSAKNLRLSATELKPYCYERLFQACGGLQDAPDLSLALNVPSHAFYYAFYGCGLTSLPNLPQVTTIADNGYAYMFYGTKIATASKLVATQLGESAYSYMFYGCKSLVSVSTDMLPAVALPASAYSYMFSSCTSLLIAPKIPAIEVSTSTCSNMFNGCTALTTPPDTLFAKTIYYGTYNKMFYGCSALTKSPVIMAEELAYTKEKVGCMNSMFYNCSSLTSIEVRFKEWSTASISSSYINYHPTGNWMYGTTKNNSRIFYAPCELPASSRGDHTIQTNWTFTCFPLYTIKANGGTWDGNTDIADRVIRGGNLPSSELITPRWTDDSKVFDHWNTKSDNSGDNLDFANQPAENTTYYAIYKSASASNVTFHTNEGQWSDDKTNTDRTISISLSTIIPQVERDGYTFVKWNSEANGSGDEFTPIEPVSDYYAIWTPDLTFDVATNNAHWESGSTDNAIKTALNIETLPLAQKSDYTFVCWNTQADGSGANLDMDNLPIVPTTFYAIFTPNFTFDVATNGGTWDGTNSADSVLSTINEIPVAHRNGYSYRWNTQANGNGDDINLLSLPTTPTTFYAVFSENTYTFNVALNDATWDGEDNTNRTFTTTELLALPMIPTAQRNGEGVFAGWNTSSSATCNELDRNNLPAVSSTFYAVFRMIDYLTIIAETNNVQVGTYYVNASVPFNMQYSLDGGSTWNTVPNSRSSFCTLQTGENVLIKGVNSKGINSKENGADYISNKYLHFTISGNASLKGDLMTLITGDDTPTTEIPNDYTFAKLFVECDIVSASGLKLSATTLKRGCYEMLFNSCKKMVDAPVISAVDTIPASAFKGMFQGCSSLVNAPKLPARRLGSSAYEQMFYGCVALRSLEVGFFAWSNESVGSDYPTYNWMYNVPNTSDFVFRAPCHLDVTSTNDVSHTLSDWTYECIPYDTIITANATTGELPTLSNITVADGVTLTMNEDYAATDITILGGGKMVVSDGKALTAHSITLQGGAYDGEAYRFVYPELEVNGTIQTAEGTPTPMTYNHLLNKAQYYTMAVPTNVNAKEVLYPDGVGAPYKVQTYDGAARAEYSTTRNCWVDVWNKYNPFDPATPDVTFEAGRGYTVFCKPQAGVYSPLSFPITMDFREEGEAAEKTISVYGYGCTDGMPADKTKSGDVGWNVLGNPFLMSFGGDDYLSLETTTGTYPILYVIMPNENGTYYQVELLSNISIPAFNNFFVQIFNDGDIHFVRGNKANNAPRRATMASDVAAFGVRVEDANGSADRLGFFLSDDFTDEYDPYYDLSKWQNSGLNLYAKHAGDNLSMMAVSPATMENEIPLTLTIPATGRYTFSLVDEWARNLWAYDHIYLYDKTTGVTTDLTVEDYAFSASQGTSATRFVISAHRNEMPTGNTIVSDHKEDQAKPIKYIEDGKLVILRNGLRYDANGHCLE